MMMGSFILLVLLSHCLLSRVQSFSLELHPTCLAKPSLSSATALHMSSSTSSSECTKKRVVVTGLGVISGCGIGADDFFQACVDGKSSLGVVQRFDAQYYPCRIASEVPASMFDPNDHFVNPKNAKSNDRYTHFAVAAARQALKDGHVGDTPETLTNPERIGVMVGTAFGGMETFEQETLKLHKKPERPKVRASFCYSHTHIVPLKCLDLLTHPLFDTLTQSLLLHMYCTYTIGLSLYHSSLVGEYRIGCDRDRMRLQGSELRYHIGLCQWQSRHWGSHGHDCRRTRRHDVGRWNRSYHYASLLCRILCHESHEHGLQ